MAAGKPMFVCIYVIPFDYCCRHFDSENQHCPQSLAVNMRALLEVFLFSVLLKTGKERQVTSLLGNVRWYLAPD